MPVSADVRVKSRHVRCLAAIAECGDIAFAARRMHMSKQELLDAVSELHCILYAPTATAVIPTLRSKGARDSLSA